MFLLGSSIAFLKGPVMHSGIPNGVFDVNLLEWVEK